MKITNIIFGDVIYESGANTIRRTVLDAVNEGASLQFANLRNVDLSGVNLYGANLRGASLLGADLSRTDLRNANLRGANLSKANLYWADLRGADLSLAYLQNAILQDVDLGAADLTGAIGIYQFGPIGNANRVGIAVYNDNGIMFSLGCFWGNEEQTVEAVIKKYGENSLYEKQIRLAASILLEAERERQYA